MRSSSTRPSSSVAKTPTKKPLEHDNVDALILPSDVLYLAMQFLPVTDLSAMSLVSKSCRGSITTEMVVRSAVMRTGDRFNTRKSMDELYKLMYSNAIHVPSTLRLLRIATGRKCEFCFCEHKTLAAWSYGVFSCWNCVSGRRECLSKSWDTKWVRYGRNEDQFDAVLNHPRNAISKLFGRKYYVWGEHRTVSEEKVGPIMAWEDIDGAVNYMGDTDDSADFIQKIDEYIEDKLEAPSIVEYNEFNKAYTMAKTDLEERNEHAEQLKAERRRVREERKRKQEAEQQAKEERKRKREAAKQARQAAKRARDAETEDPEGVVEETVQPDGVDADPPIQHSSSIDHVDDQHGPDEQVEGNNNEPPTTGSVVCAACNEPKSKANFSKSQLRKRSGVARCKVCVLANTTA